MKIKIKLFALFMAVVLFFCAGISSVTTSYISAIEKEAYSKDTTIELYNNMVEIYRETVTVYCSMYVIPEYVDTIIKMLCVYNDTHSTDVLNSSYSYLNTRYEHKNEGITDINYSLMIGIQQLSEWVGYMGSKYNVEPIDNNDYLLVLLQAYELQCKDYIDYAINNGGYSASSVVDYCSSNSFLSGKNQASINSQFAILVLNMFIVSFDETNEVQKNIVKLAIDSENYSTNRIRANGGYCLRFANDVLRAAGLDIKRTDCARCSGDFFGVSNDFNNIPIGALIYCNASQQYGHVGIYIGNNYVVHCSTYKSSNATVLLTVSDGYVLKQPLFDFIISYEAMCWGFSGAWADEYPYQSGKYMCGVH